MELLSHAAGHNAGGCALLLCNRMLVPEARFCPPDAAGGVGGVQVCLSQSNLAARSNPIMASGAACRKQFTSGWRSHLSPQAPSDFRPFRIHNTVPGSLPWQHYVRVSTRGLNIRGLRQLAVDAARRAEVDPATRRVARALALGLQRAVAAEGGGEGGDEGGGDGGGEGGKGGCGGEGEGGRVASLRRLEVSGASSVVETSGEDLSEGVERVPVPWRNTTGDGEVPPPLVYLRSCISGDAYAVTDRIRKLAKRCRGDGQHFGAPYGPRIECHPWCEPPNPSRSAVQRGLRFRLEVYRHGAPVGWGVRTLEVIPKGSVVMEYVGEHCSRTTAEHRVARWPSTDVYLMEIGKGGNVARSGGFTIDALHARNVSAFANFACYPNMRKEPVLSAHWDTRFPHAVFIATRDIAADEELTYRRDEGARRGSSDSRVPCMCGHVVCRKWV